MTYKVEFEVDGDSVFYTVKAQNVLDAEESAKKRLEKDKSIDLKCGKGYHNKGKAYREGSYAYSWEVKHIENIHDGGEGR